MAEITESQCQALAALRKMRSKKFGEKFSPEEIASAEDADRNIRYLWVPDICHQWALGRVGYAMNRFMQVIGKDGSGKTSTIFDMQRLVHEANGIGAGVETELAIQVEQGRTYLGDYWDAFQEFLNTPDSFENGLQMLVYYVDMFEKIDPEAKLPKMLSFDSIAGSGTERVTGGGTFVVGSCGSFGEKANMLKDVLEHLKPKLRRNNILVVFGNQGKEQIDPNAVPGQKTREVDRVKGQGGRSIDFNTTYWLYTKRMSAQKDGHGDVSGFHQKCIFRRNKLRIPDRSFERDVVFYKGFDYGKTTLDILAATGACGLKKVAGGYYHCQEIGVSPSDKLRASEMYDLVHSPEHVGKFISCLDILVPDDLSKVFFPASWGGRVPTFTKKEAKADAGQIEPPDPEELAPIE